MKIVSTPLKKLKSLSRKPAKFDPNQSSTYSADHVNAAEPLLKLLTIVGGLLAAVLLIGGIYLAVNGTTADTTFNMFGNQFSSTSVGVSMASIGAVFGVLIFKRVMKLIGDLAKLP